ncbi:MAG TPA: hypothetical protein VHW09_06720 [Bryobacteraceae bacterium]|jgi:hypothetical protein|nr:hypothetical protein [Bryobacteraceae bacterium]
MTPPLKPGWKKPLPEQLARPTYWPAVLALGIMVALLGPVTDMAVSVVGLLSIVCALIGWIGELLHE